MTLLGLAGVLLAGLAGPLLSAPRGWRIPMVVGELLLGVVIGRTGFGWAHSGDAVFTFLAQAGFALVMLVAGTHVPVRDAGLRRAFGRGALVAVAIGVLAIPIAVGLSALAHTGHAPMYAVLVASSSAALVMPVVDDDKLAGPDVLTMLAQVAIADTACIVALPLVTNPAKAGRSAVGAAIIIAIAAALYVLFAVLARRGVLLALHNESVTRTFGLEMRLSLLVLFALAGLAQRVHVSVMLAGFATGIALAAIGPPRRLASQFFAVTEGFLGPVFFVWLGASLDLRALATHPKLIVLGFGLAVGALAAHAVAAAFHQRISLAMLSAAQLGVPVAAVTIGTQNGMLRPGEGGAILAAALVTVGVAAAAGAVAARRPADASAGVDGEHPHTGRPAGVA